MLVISGTVKIRPERRADAIKAGLAMAAASRAEAGCHAYEFAVTLEDENTFRLFEAWEDRAALDAHFKTPHMAAFNAAIAGVAAGATITEYEVSTSRPLAVGRR